jgi:membrane carboxypeptidase/penicillin-binding protein PbpC
LLAAIGIERAVEFGRRLGITSFKDSSRYDLSLTLGGGEVTLLDLTAAYATFAAGGERVEPLAVLRVEDNAGHVIYEARRPSREQALRPDNAYLISDILSDNNARAPSFGLNSPLRLTRPAAAKTGTTSDFRDNWTVGYTPDLAVGVWVGNADNTPMRRVSGIDGAAPIWRDIMEIVLKEKAPAAFAAPQGIHELVVCVPSGLLPTPYCPRTRLEKFAPGTEPVVQDDYYRPLLVCDATGRAVASRAACPGSTSQHIYAFVPLEAVPWARAAGIPLPPVPPYAGGANDGVAGPDGASAIAVTLVAPSDGAVLHVSREIPLDEQALRIEALPAAGARDVELFVDAAPIGRADAAPYRVNWQLSEGTHEIRARAVDLAGNETWSQTTRVTVLPP